MSNFVNGFVRMIYGVWFTLIETCFTKYKQINSLIGGNYEAGTLSTAGPPMAKNGVPGAS